MLITLKVEDKLDFQLNDQTLATVLTVVQIIYPALENWIAQFYLGKEIRNFHITESHG